jgi:hypothetical protein
MAFWSVSSIRQISIRLVRLVKFFYFYKADSDKVLLGTVPSDKVPLHIESCIVQSPIILSYIRKIKSDKVLPGKIKIGQSTIGQI